MLNAEPHPRLRCATTCWIRRGVRGADEIEEMSTFGLVELQCASDPFQDSIGRAAWALPAFELRVVLDADVGEDRDLVAAKAGNPPIASVGRQSRLFGSDAGAPAT